MRRSRHEVAGAGAAVAGGAMWAVKGAVILAVGDQPPLLFEVAGLLFPLALVGLHHRLSGGGGRPGQIGGLLARLAGLGALATAAYGGLVREPSDVLLGALIALTALSTFIGLLLLGLAARSTEALPERWRNLPAAMGIAAIPAIMVGGVLEAIHERLLEVPIVVLGIGWALLGVVLLAPHADERRGAGTPAGLR